MTTATVPAVTKNLDGYGFPPIEWERLGKSLDKIASFEPTDPAGRLFLATTNPDGSPHVMPVGIVWFDERFYFTAGAGTVKSKNIARDPRVVVSVAAPSLDVVAEGQATIVRDEVKLQRLAKRYAEEGWAPEVRDGALWHEYSAPSAGPPPWDLYEIIPTTIYGLSTDEPHGATRWRL